MKYKSLVSISDLDADEILEIIKLASFFEKKTQPELLQNKIIASVFYEPSTRTRLSFETAVQRLGGRIIGFADVNTSSVRKGESFKDTILTIANYSDLIIIRHPLEGSARYAAEISPIPIINAGDGANQHPTQTLLDLYSIEKTQGRLEDLKIFIVGDLKYGRTVHSLIIALSHFNPYFVFISHPELRLSSEYIMFLKEKNIKFSEQSDFSSLEHADILYITRVQKERFSDPIEYEKVKDYYRLNLSMLKNVKPNLKIMHPLPRVDEIASEVDESPYAYYFQQARNGVYIRQAIISKILGLK